MPTRTIAMLSAIVLLAAASSLIAAPAPELAPFATGEPAPKPAPTTEPNRPAALRLAGDTIAEAVIIASVPFDTTGSTTGYNHDYDEACPYSGSVSPDVVYAYSPPLPAEVDFDLLGSTYDTKIYLYDAAMNLVACNDDHYPDYVSALVRIPLAPASAPYYVVIDGYGGDHGDYVLTVTDQEPCDLDVGYPYQPEGEPELEDGYADWYNGGCNSPEYGSPFQTIGPFFPSAEYHLVGRSGWFLYGGTSRRDTDWFITRLDQHGHLRVVIDAEEETFLFHLAPTDCDEVAVAAQVTAGPCEPATLEVQGEPFEEVWLWVGPTTFEPPMGFEGYEYDYTLEIDGHSWPHLGLGGGDDYTFRAPRLEFSQTWLGVSPNPLSVNDVDLGEHCGGASTPGPDYFASVYLQAGEQVGGTLHPFYIARSPADDVPVRMTLALTSDVRTPGACVGVVQSLGDNQPYLLGPAPVSGWYHLIADYREGMPLTGSATVNHPASPPPPAPLHDTCAGAVVLPVGPFTLTDDLSDCTDAVDPGRDGCAPRPDLAYTGRDAIYRVEFGAGDVLTVTMTADGGWDEALYLVRDCEQPLGACVAAGLADGDGVRLQYTALEDETLWLVCDSWGVGPRAFTLDGVLGTTTNVATPPATPERLALRASPNPFNPRVNIAYDLPRSGPVRLRVHALDGRVVAELVDGPMAAGVHEVAWAGRDERGRSLPSGVYVARVEAAGEVSARRLTLLK